jgi:alpha-D-ribose 1-methylphosphonate 5-triphosphate diphosphatase PhnM
LKADKTLVGGGALKIASVGPHIVVPGQENDSKLDVVDYSGVTSVSDADVSGDSTNEAKKEAQNFSRIFDLIQEAEKRKKKERGIDHLQNKISLTT